MMIADRVNAGARRVPTWVIYALGMVPAALLVAGIFTGGLGVDPVKTLEHETGELALKFFIASMCVTPLARFGGIRLLKFRRALGLITFIYVTLHLIVWVGLDMTLLWEQMWRDIWKRPYITVGMVGFLLILPLAVTSNNASIKRFGAAGWQKLHRLAYPAILLGAIHYVMVQKVWEVEPLVYLAVISALLALRLVPKAKPRAAAAV